MSDERRRTRGRPRTGESDARARILVAAEAAFARDGYDRASLRGIAADAGVDPRLIRYHFGPRADLFAATLALRVTPARVVGAMAAAPGNAPLGDRLVAALLATWADADAAAPLHAALSTAITDPSFADVFRRYLEAELVTPLADALEGPRRRERAAAAITVAMGLIVARYVLRLPTMAEASTSAVGRAMTPAMRAALR